MRSRRKPAGRVCAALALALLCAACFVETREGVPPAYPGSSIGPGSRFEGELALAVKQKYWTPDSYRQVVEYYEGYTSGAGGFEGGAGRDGLALWKKNMSLDASGTIATPLDASRPGALIVVTKESARTVVTTYASLPNP